MPATTFDIFKARAEAVSAEVHRLGTKSDALSFISTFLQDNKVTDAEGSYALWAAGAFLDAGQRAEFASEVPGLRFDVSRDLAANTKIGISQMDYGIAATGTLVHDATAVNQRLVSTLPIIHVALVPTNNILPDMPALFTKLGPRNANYIALITGPSRTADIERVLTIGVHGPERLIILAIDDMQRAIG